MEERCARRRVPFPLYQASMGRADTCPEIDVGDLAGVVGQCSYIFTAQAAVLLLPLTVLRLGRTSVRQTSRSGASQHFPW
jgi:hypothetical protein